ncbi:imidazole glycerol phosphate synthase subunit HisF [Sphingopyxis granuli]|uniref:imidazole glycerol phosphate synthase subunit HisF n=1 Tax=Sphingopyxis granuli TaxID=267128 RepID=UPI001BB07530|nr:imidazole glycerol phosphate synthase cyclase subunit [Sphingopyxis granuli]QUM71315.1 imidazole glycerol phosphate synthase subunit HisF [Sphingopyxis granuli]
MLKKRLIPKLLIQHRQIGSMVRPVLVTTRQFDQSFDVGDPVSQAKIYQAQMADELIVLNIDRTAIGTDELLLGIIERLASETFMPLAVGGGVAAVDDFARLLDHGADKVVINTLAEENPGIIDLAANQFGAQCVVVSIDYRRDEDGTPRVYTDRASRPTGRGVVEWAHEAAKRGAGEIVLVDAERDGTGNGLDCALCAEVAHALPIPVILSGGCGVASHFSDGFLDGGAEAISAGTFFAFRDQNPIQTRSHVRNSGIAIRMET